VFVKQLGMLGNVSVVEVRHSQVQEDIKEKGKIQDRKVKTEILNTDRILNRPVNAQDPERLYQEIQEKEQAQVGEEFFLHTRI